MRVTLRVKTQKRWELKTGKQRAFSGEKEIKTQSGFRVGTCRQTGNWCKPEYLANWIAGDVGRSCKLEG